MADELHCSTATVKKYLTRHSLQVGRVSSIHPDTHSKTVWKECPAHGLKKHKLYSAGKFPNGADKYTYFCCVCIAAKPKQRRNRNKLWAVEQLGGKCSECNYDEYLGALHFHHLSGKNIGISRILHYSREQIAKELSLCELICANCHLDKHSYLSDDLATYSHRSQRSARLKKLKAIEIFGGACLLCDEARIGALQFHHIEPCKKTHSMSVSEGFNKPAEIVWQELLKCVLLCANCHAEVEAGLHPDATSIWLKTQPVFNISSKDWHLRLGGVYSKKYEPRENPQCSDCKKVITQGAIRCVKCAHLLSRKIQKRPAAAQLQIDVSELGYLGTGRKYGVSDNTIRQWLKTGCPDREQE